MDKELRTQQQKTNVQLKMGRHVKLLAAWAAGPGKAQKAGATESALPWNAEGWNRAQRRARSTQSGREPEQRRGEAAALPPHSARELATWTRDHLRPPVSGRKWDTEETGQTEAK